ncbi:hypothetical protein K501DRAFT_274877 [Backusella circina FSU 941]|nr:hypothetical protein K501DRAFT_274877 [Backusella circina FSU 941]
MYPSYPAWKSSLALNPLSHFNLKLKTIPFDSYVQLEVEQFIGKVGIQRVKMTAFKMDLEFDGQYRMLDIGQFFLVRDNINDIMLVPIIMQKLAQIKEITEKTTVKLLKAIKGQGASIDKKSYMRNSKTCTLLSWNLNFDRFVFRDSNSISYDI